MLDSYLFQLIGFSKPDFSCWSNFSLFLVDKVTAGTYNFVSVILSFPSPVELVITQSLDHVKIRLTSQLINGFSSVLQKLLKYFSGPIISTSFAFPSAGVFPVIFVLYLNDSDLAKLSLGISLEYWNNFQRFLNNYHCIQLSYTWVLQCEYHEYYLCLYYLLYLYT